MHELATSAQYIIFLKTKQWYVLHVLFYPDSKLIEWTHDNLKLIDKR